MNCKIKEFREAANLTQAQIAKAAGVTIGAVSQWECGRCNPSAVALLRISRAFNCNPEDLLDTEVSTESNLNL